MTLFRSSTSSRRTRAVAFGAIAALALTLPAAPASAAGKSSSPRTITVNGSGSAEIVRDRARIAMDVTALRPTAREAYTRLAATTTEVRSAVIAAGAKNADLTTTGISLYPEYRYYDNTREFLGYRASARFTVLATVAAAPAILDAAVAVGNDDVALNGISFESSNRAAAMKKARAAAVTDARSIAAQLTSAAKVRIHQVISISESTSSPSYPPMFLDRAEAASLPVDPGTEKITVSVTIVYSLK
jgi:uncharacterized protein YggE